VYDGSLLFHVIGGVYPEYLLLILHSGSFTA
jgi:hypothetical protein